MSGKLNGSKVYLIGSVDRVDIETAKKWRVEVSTTLSKLGVKSYDPCNKPTQYAQEINIRQQREQLIEEENYTALSELMRPICRYDLRMLDKSDFMIVYVDVDVHIAGSYHELAWALLRRKPTLVVVKQGKKNCPYWWFGVMPHEHIFSSFDEMYEYLCGVNSGVFDSKHWKFFYPDF